MTDESFNMAFATDFINEDYLPNKKFGYLEHIKPICFEELCRIEDTVAGLLGHRLRDVTNRYTHNVDSSQIDDANKISLYIAQILDKQINAEDVI